PVEAAAACKAHDWVKMGELMYQSHASMRDDFQITCSELDTLVDLAAAKGVEGGVYGARMTGGGFGGCAVALVKTDAVEDLMAYFAKEYEAKTGIKPFIFVSRPGNGSAIES
ncbi:MAG: galactokinase, partial [Thermoguttaceae bacterium]|nr:galactokinase [Thermoguttaceae bacterium]